jgi:hypothetical protein
MERLGEDAIGTIVAGVEDAPSDGATVFVSPRGGAVTDPPTDATAYPHRSDAHHCLVEARWDDPERDAAHDAWVRSLHEALQPYATGDVALNFQADDEPPERRRAADGDNSERFLDVKRVRDPAGVFGGPAPVEPSGHGSGRFRASMGTRFGRAWGRFSVGEAIRPSPDQIWTATGTTQTRSFRCLGGSKSGQCHRIYKV